MSERKVLNKYYPPDFDPAKIPRMKLSKNRQYTVRLMAPFNMRCVTCGEYIYKGKKFNARKEDVEGEDYLGVRIFRFYIKCTRCLQEISFRTDPQNTDYEIEAGATRNFMALKLAEEQLQKEEDERIADEATNPMKLLENRTKQSKQELELLESLEELKDLNKRQRSVDFDTILSQYKPKTEAEQEQEDEEYIKSVYKTSVPSDPAKKVIVEEIIENIDEPAGLNTLKHKPAVFTATVPVKVQKLDNQPKLVNSTADKVITINNSSVSKTKKSIFSGLVKIKPRSDPGPAVEDSKSKAQPAKSTSGALTMLGSYSDSETSE